MANITIKDIRISGIATCVPSHKEQNVSLSRFNENEMQKLIKLTGIEERRVANQQTCTSDLCEKAALKLMNDLGWQSSDIDALVFVSQTPDYILPTTSSILQHKLGISGSCFTLDITDGCSGYINGLITLGQLMSGGNIKKGLLLVGDTISKVCNPNDKSTYPLFGDAGTATALEYKAGAPDLLANKFSDGSGYSAIQIKDGGFRNKFNENSLVENTLEENIVRSACDLELNGMDVFTFGISRAPECVTQLIADYNINKDSIDYFIFHQANKFMNDTIRKKLLIRQEQVPYSLKEFGNTSSASIPITICSQLNKELTHSKLNLIICGFGVGLSWGSIYVELDNIVCPEIIEY